MRLRSAAIVLTMFLVSCAAREPVVSTGEKASNVGGTISGIVRTASGDTPLAGRKVTVVNVETGEKLETSTAVSGGYTIKVPRGHYRLEVELRPGEALSDKPDDVHITTSDIDAGRDFVITVKPPVVRQSLGATTLERANSHVPREAPGRVRTTAARAAG